jgi:hypothetical protein
MTVAAFIDDALFLRLTMKKTIIYLSIATLMTMVSTVDAVEPVVHGSPVLPASPADPASDNTKNPLPVMGSSNHAVYESKLLEPAIHNTVRELVNTSHEGLVEEKTSKGVGMKLKGRFRTVPVATIEEDGTITVRDYTSVPPAE